MGIKAEMKNLQGFSLRRDGCWIITENNEETTTTSAVPGSEVDTDVRPTSSAAAAQTSTFGSGGTASWCIKQRHPLADEAVDLIKPSELY